MLSYIITYALMLFYYTLFFMTATARGKKNGGQLRDVLAGKAEPRVLFNRLITGVFFLAVGSLILSIQRGIDLSIISFTWNANYVVWMMTAAALIVGISTAPKKSVINNSIHSLPLHLPLLFVLTRTLFLIVYEFFFRGMMLFIMIEDMGVVVGIILNLILYMLVHWFNKQERYGSLIMGGVLCTVTLYYHSVWPAIIVHLSLALSHEISALIKYRSLIKKSWL